jgi:N-terminal region of Chorein or VPS13
MVFESIVADILNRYLGEYVENLDKGQLKIGIWGGKKRNPQCFAKSLFHENCENKNRFFFSC